MTADRGPLADAGALPAPWGSSPYLRTHHGTTPFRHVWATPEAVLLVPEGESRGLLGLGSPGAVAALADALPEELRANLRRLTVPRGALELMTVPEQLLGARSEWDWMWAGAPLRDVESSGVERLEPTAANREEVVELLSVAHPTTDTDPADPRLLGWWGLRESGRLVAVVGALREGPAQPRHLVSLGVHPEHRGRRLAGRVLAAAVLDALAEEVEPRGVSLALYAANERARRVYVRHGFELRHEFSSLRSACP